MDDSERGRRDDMSTGGIQAVFLETHSWGRAVAEVPADHQPDVRIVFRVPDTKGFHVPSEVDVVSPFEDTHWGTKPMVVRDPDGRLWNLEAPGHG
jgi:hypothetical protein